MPSDHEDRSKVPDYYRDGMNADDLPDDFFDDGPPPELDVVPDPNRPGDYTTRRQLEYETDSFWWSVSFLGGGGLVGWLVYCFSGSWPVMPAIRWGAIVVVGLLAGYVLSRFRSVVTVIVSILFLAILAFIGYLIFSGKL